MDSRSPFPGETNYRNNICVRYLGKARHEDNALFYIRGIVVFANNNVNLKMKSRMVILNFPLRKLYYITLVKDGRNGRLYQSLQLFKFCLCRDIEN